MECGESLAYLVILIVAVAVVVWLYRTYGCNDYTCSNYKQISQRCNTERDRTLLLLNALALHQPWIPSLIGGVVIGFLIPWWILFRPPTGREFVSAALLSFLVILALLLSAQYFLIQPYVDKASSFILTTCGDGPPCDEPQVTFS